MPNAKVMFKRGTQSALNTLINGSGERFVDGSFYLTTDTNRLYVAQSATNLVELNKSITVVDTIDDLPTSPSQVEVGQFYYIAGPDATAQGTHNGNILAVVTGFTNGSANWVQINPDTNTDTGYDRNTTMAVTKSSVETVDGNKRIPYTITLNAEHTGVNGSNTTTTNTPVTATFYVEASDIGNIAVATDISVSSTAVSNNKTTVTVSDSGSNTSGSFVLAGGTNVTLTGGNTSDITINAKDTTYALSSGVSGTSDAKVTLTPTVVDNNGSTAGSTQNIIFKAGTDLTVSGATAGEITYAHDTYGAPTVTSLAADDADYTNNVKEFNVVDAITTSNGHVTAVTKKRVSVTDSTFTANSITADNTGALTFTIKNDKANTTTTASSGQVLFHKITVDGTEVTKYNQESLGSFYSASEIDNKISGLNAMTYKGKVGTAADGGDVTALPTIPDTASESTIKTGDTYLVVTDGTYGGKTAKVGDLLIASGTESNGVITSNLDWTLVEAGERDTTYNYQAATVNSLPALQYKSNTSGTPSNTWNTIVSFEGTDGVTASLANNKITIDHDDSGVTAGTKGDNSSITAALDYGDSFKVPVVTVNAQGHVTSLGEQSITLPAADNITYTISAVQNTGTSEANIRLTPSTGSATNAVVIGDGTSITAAVDSNNKLKISHSDLLTSGTAGTTYGTSASTTPAASGSIKVPNIKVNAQGHVTEISEQTITLPADNDHYFQLRPTTVSVSSNTATATLNMSDTTAANSNATTATIKLTSESLVIASTSNTDEIKVDIEWGTFT